MKDLHIIGSGGFCKQVIEIVEEINEIRQTYNLIGIIDDDTKLLGTKLLNYEIIGDTDYLKELSQKTEVYAAIAIGNGKVREKLSNKLENVKWENLIHPKSIVSKYTTIGVGNIICSGVIINPMCILEDHCNINIGCTLGHDVKLEAFSTLMPGCNISGNVNVGKFSMVGTGSCIIQNKTIGNNSIVGAGAVVTKDVDPHSTYVGIPARKIKDAYKNRI